MSYLKYFWLAVITSSLWWTACNDSESSSNPFLISDTSVISKIIISGKTRVILTKQKGKWLVNEQFEAYPKSIKRLMQILSQAELKGQVPNSEADSVLQNINKHPLKVDIYKSDKLINTWTCGFYDENYNATTVVSPKQKAPFLFYLPGVTKDLRPLISDNQMYWMTAYLFDYEYFELSEISLENKDKPEDSFHLKIESDTAYVSDIKQNKNYPTNLRAVGRYLTYFKAVKFDSLLQTSDIPETEPVQILTIKDKTGKLTKLELFYRFKKDSIIDPHKIYGRLNDTTSVIIKRYNLDLLLKKRTYFTNQ